MKNLLAIAIGSAALCACQPVKDRHAEGTPAPNGTAAVPSPAPSASGPYVATAPLPPSSAPTMPAAPSELVGEYRVAGVDGRAVDLPHAITVSITAETIRYTSQCVGGTWRYRRESDRLVTEEIPMAVCQRALYPEEQAIDALFAAGPTLRPTDTNGIELAGGGHTITVYSQ